jgi:YVTN family beta-propeller protein
MGVALDDRRVYATRYPQPLTGGPADGEGTLVVLDRTTLQVVHAGIPVGRGPRRVAVNPATRRAYVVNTSQLDYSLSVIDTETLAVVATIPLGQGPTHVAVNPATNRVYVSNWFAGRVHVLDGATNELLEPIILDKGPQGLHVDPTRNRIYVAIMNRSVPPFRNGLVAIDDDGSGDYEVQPFVDLPPLSNQSIDVLADPDRDRVYVANLGGGGTSPGVMALHAADLGVVATVGIHAAVRSLALNSDAEEIYVASNSGVHVVDTGTLTVARHIPGGPTWGLTAAPGTARQLFVAELRGNLLRLT